ncbi:arylesterase [Flexithrix dorotheae]|uniref:arylesterase n=1 Tax=Flexithrix dorotheae TaxID=70993 RepID=UPI00039B8449|nr:arylesterase [Flexithrix dorotheae]
MKRNWISLLSLLFLIACSSKQNDSKPEVSKDEKVQPNLEEENKVAENSELKTVIFFGNSLSAGYGLDEPDKYSFPALIQKKINEKGLPYNVVNAGLSGETTAAGLNRIDWILKQHVDVFVLELGGNDGLRGIPTTESYKNLQGIIDKVKSKNPEVKIILAGMEAPPNMGNDYTSAFRNMYPELADKNQVGLIPFLLDKVGGEADLNQSDGIHPNVDGHAIVAENVWEILEGVLEKESV